jgi:hypothetical protein
VVKVKNDRVSVGLVVILRHEQTVRHGHGAELEHATFETLEIVGRRGRRLHGACGAREAGKSHDHRQDLDEKKSHRPFEWYGRAL